MAHDEPAGLMAFWADIHRGYEPRFLEWHNCEHMPERVSVPGFREGHRYRIVGETPRYLMMYLTEGADVLESDAYIERLNHPTPWTRESLGHFRNPTRNVYTLLGARGRVSLREAPYLISVRFDIAAPAEPRLRAAVQDDLLPAWVASPEVARVRFYGIDAAVSGIETAERGIYEGGPGSQRFLLLAECARPDVVETEGWRASWAGLDTGSGDDSPAIAHVTREAYRVDYVLPAA